MSPALVKKYLEAARQVAEQLVLTQDGLEFAPHPVVTETDRDKYCVNRIIAFYKRQHTDYAEYFLAAWRFKHRAALGQADLTLPQIATQAGISAPYLQTIWDALEGPREEVGPVAALQALWRELPARDAKQQQDAARAGCERMRDFVVALRAKLVPKVNNLSAPRVNESSQPLVLWKDRQMAANRRRYAERFGAQDRGRRPTGRLRSGEGDGRPDDRRRGRRAVRGNLRRGSARPSRMRSTCRSGPRLSGPGEGEEVGQRRPAAERGLPQPDGLLPRRRPALRVDAGRGRPARVRPAVGRAGFRRRRPASPVRGVRLVRPDRFVASCATRSSTSPAPRTRTSRRRPRWTGSKKSTPPRPSGPASVDGRPQAMHDYFRNMSATFRKLEEEHAAAEPTHLEALKAFAERAYRRPLSKPESGRAVAFYRSLRDQRGPDARGGGPRHADQRADVAALLLPRSTCRGRRAAAVRIRRPPAGRLRAGQPAELLPLVEHARPDAARPRGRRASCTGRKCCAAQARRMLRDDRARGLATEFAGNWLDFRRFEQHNGVDRERLPGLHQRAAAGDVRGADPLLHRTSSGATARCSTSCTATTPSSTARSRGITACRAQTGTPADQWVRVDGAGQYGRGGLLPMAVFLTNNSPGLRTSPVKRGNWVVKRVLGEHIPPPPAKVPELPSDESKLGDLTLRQTLERHRADPSCAACHARFDSFGLVFEGYGPVGERRDEGPRRPAGRQLGRLPGRQRRRGPRRPAGLRPRSGARTISSRTCAASCWPYGLGRTLLPSGRRTLRCGQMQRRPLGQIEATSPRSGSA